MNPKDSSNGHQPSLSFIQDEFRGHAGILREVLVSIRIHPKAVDFVIVVIKSIQYLKELIKDSPLSPALPLLDALEEFFQTVQAGMVITPAQLEILSMVIAELVQMADIKEYLRENNLSSRSTFHEQWIIRLKEFVNRYKKENRKKEKTFKEEEKEIVPSPRFDLALLAIFNEELKKNVTTIREKVATLSLEPENLKLIDELAKIVQTIHQSADLIKIDPLLHLTDHLEKFLKSYLDPSKKLNDEDIKILNRINAFLDQISQTETARLYLVIEEKEEDAEQLSDELRRRFTEHPQKEQIFTPIPRPEPIQEEPKVSEVILDQSMINLFQTELETQTSALTNGIIELEQNPENESLLETLMRSAHSIKGAARIVSLNSIVRLAHAMEDCFVAAQKKTLKLSIEDIDRLLQVIDLFVRLSKVPFDQINTWLKENLPLIEKLTLSFHLPQTQIKQIEKLTQPLQRPKKEESVSKLPVKRPEGMKPFQISFTADRVLRVTAQNLNRLMGLAGESLVESRWLYPFEDSLQRLKKNFDQVDEDIDFLRDTLKSVDLPDITQQLFSNVQHALNNYRNQLSEKIVELDNFIRRHSSLSDRLYQEVINSRMRPFADGVETFPRFVRDLARQLGKRVKLEIEGKLTPVDRDILEKLESPLSHLLRNAVDHGIEFPDERRSLGKPPEGVIKLEARHKGGMLLISVSDDGRGINIEQLRAKIVENNLVAPEIASHLKESEIIDFLFLPGFSTSTTVSEISGRGIGLNVVQNVVQEFGGAVNVEFKEGKGLIFHMQLPLTISVIRALLVEISKEPYAFPLAHIDKAFLLDRSQISFVENRQFFHYEGKNIGLISAWQVLELEESPLASQFYPVIVISDRLSSYGLVVDRLIGEKELVVQELDARLEKVQDISAGALMEDGNPVLIIDVEEMVATINSLLSGGKLNQLMVSKKKASHEKPNKRILVIDDSLTVREVECRLLENQGYEVETAVNGMEGWNAIRIGKFDLVITDIEMPRMDGIELIKTMKKDSRFSSLPVMIVSYKEKEEEKIKGLQAGADYYLTKSSFHDATLLDAVHDLIGNP